MSENSKYSVYHTFTLPNGTKKKKRFYGRTMREAAQKRDEFIAEFGDGIVDFDNDSTVAEYAEVWMRRNKLDSVNRNRMQKYCLDVIGGYELRRVLTSNIEDCFALTDGMSRSSVSKITSLIRKMFHSMLKDRLIPYNPCDDAKVPNAEAGSRRALTDSEEKVFLSELEKSVNNGRWHDIAFGIMYACGLRPGEVRALTLNNISLADSPTITITQACKNKTQEIGKPKTKAGIREVPIPLWFVPILSKALKERDSDSLLIFDSSDGRPISHQCLTRRWGFLHNRMKVASGAKTYRNRIISPSLTIGEDITMYYLRHTFCTNLVYAGIPEIVAMKWMGHGDPNMVRKIYAHANKKIVDQSIALLNKNPILSTDFKQIR